MTYCYHRQVRFHLAGMDRVRADVERFHAMTNLVRKSRLGYCIAYADGPTTGRWDDVPLDPIEGCLMVDAPQAGVPLRRPSQRSFDPRKPVPWSHVLALLSTSFARRDATGSRPYPSAGRLYPVEVLLAVLPSRIRDLPDTTETVFHWRPERRNLEPLVKRTERQLLASANDLTTESPSLEYNTLRFPAFFLFYGVNLDLSVMKYRQRGYRYALLEAGAMCQQADLVANSLGMGSCLVGGFGDNELAVLLGINPARLLPVVIQGFGARPEDRE